MKRTKTLPFQDNLLLPPNPLKDIAPAIEEKPKKNRVLGTADYMAPEVIEGEDHTPALDFWSLGVIAFEFMTS